MANLIFFVLGLVGAGCCVYMFWAIEQERVDGNSLKYYIINGIGGFLILISVLHDFDGGDMGSVAVEGAWVVISLMGIFKLLRKGRADA